MTTINKSIYSKVESNKRYEIVVSELFDRDDYRVGLYEQHNPKIVECFDLRLTRPSDRRALEEYVNDMKNRYNIVGVWFGRSCTNLYPFEMYREQYSSYQTMNFLNDINL